MQQEVDREYADYRDQPVFVEEFRNQGRGAELQREQSAIDEYHHTEDAPQRLVVQLGRLGQRGPEAGFRDQGQEAHEDRRHGEETVVPRGQQPYHDDGDAPGQNLTNEARAPDPEKPRHHAGAETHRSSPGSGLAVSRSANGLQAWIVQYSNFRGRSRSMHR